MLDWSKESNGKKRTIFVICRDVWTVIWGKQLTVVCSIRALVDVNTFIVSRVESLTTDTGIAPDFVLTDFVIFSTFHRTAFINVKATHRWAFLIISARTATGETSDLALASSKSPGQKSLYTSHSSMSTQLGTLIAYTRCKCSWITGIHFGLLHYDINRYPFRTQWYLHIQGHASELFACS